MFDGFLGNVDPVRHEEEERKEAVKQTPVRTDQEELSSVIKLFMGASGLDEQQAKSLVYTAVATHGLPHLGVFPLIALQGDYTTGKTTLLRLMQSLCYQPVWIDGKATDAAFRDGVGHDTTALVDEADGVPEHMLINRYSRQSSFLSIKRQNLMRWDMDQFSIFGATVLHRRDPFKDPAVLSRAIIVETKPAENIVPFRTDDVEVHADAIRRIGSSIPWQSVVSDTGSRTDDTWEPVLRVGKWLEDEEWLEYANSQIERAKASISQGQQGEVKSVVFSAILAAAVDGGYGPQLPEPLGRVALPDVVRSLAEEGVEYNPWQVGEVARRMGFETKKVGGKTWIYTGGKDQLASVDKELGINDGYFDGSG